MISRMKSPVHKINSVTTSGTSTNKVANSDCFAKAINHQSEKKKNTKTNNQTKKKKQTATKGAKALLHFGAFSSFLFCLTQNIAFSLFVYNYVLKIYIERSKPVLDLPLADAEALVFHTILAQQSSSVDRNFFL